MTFDLLAIVRPQIEQMPQSMAATHGADPAFEWVDVMFARDAMGEVKIVSLVGGAQVLGDASALRSVLDTVGSRSPREIVVLVNAWVASVMNDDEGSAWRGNVRNHPNAQEQLVIYHANVGVVQAFTARVERHDDRPPTLAPWEPGDAIGPLADALRDATR